MTNVHFFEHLENANKTRISRLKPECNRSIWAWQGHQPRAQPSHKIDTNNAKSNGVQTSRRLFGAHRLRTALTNPFQSPCTSSVFTHDHCYGNILNKESNSLVQVCRSAHSWATKIAIDIVTHLAIFCSERINRDTTV